MSVSEYQSRQHPQEISAISIGKAAIMSKSENGGWPEKPGEKLCRNLASSGEEIWLQTAAGKKLASQLAMKACGVPLGCNLAKTHK